MTLLYLAQKKMNDPHPNHAQGRMRTNKTWQSCLARTGTAITRWNYDAYLRP